MEISIIAIQHMKEPKLVIIQIPNNDVKNKTQKAHFMVMRNNICIFLED